MSNIAEDEIISIEEIGEIDTIDIQVSGNNLFLANEILTHNSGYSVEPSITALSESYALGATADFIGSLWQGDGDNEMGIMRHSLLKNRFGRNAGTTALKIDYSTLTITEDEAINCMTQDSQDSSDLLSRFAR